MVATIKSKLKTKPIPIANKPAENSWLYKLTLVAAVMQPLMTLPQAIQLYTMHNASGLSLITWVGYLIFGSLFLVYGLRYRLFPIALTQSIWLVLQSSVVVGIIIWS